LREVPQEAIKRVAIPTTTINFAIFMVSNIYCKLNKFDAKTEGISEINAKLIVENPINVAKLQKRHGDFFAMAATQHELQSKALKKIPTFIKAGCILDKRAYEQCTSEDVAIWKANYFKSKNLLSLTGGFGVDDWAWAKTGCNVTSVDTNNDLNCLVAYNAEKLGVDINRQTMSAETYLEMHSIDGFDLIYIDPDRRDGQIRISNRVDLFSPNIFELIEKYPSKNWLIKLSPMVDSEFLSHEIKKKLSFYSIVHKNEVKELLVLIENGIPTAPPFKEMVHIEGNEYRYFSDFKFDLEVNHGKQMYFFEPNAGVFNLKLNRVLHNDQSIVALNEQHTFFRTSMIFPKELGRTFKIISENDLIGGLNKIAKILREKYSIHEASITARECRIGTEEIRKTLKLKESDHTYLMVTKIGNEFNAWLCEKVIY
jgi:hypothetical protein